MPNFTPRVSTPLTKYIYMWPLVCTHKHKNAHAAIHPHTHTSLALDVQGKRVEIEKGRKLYVRGKRNARRTKYLRSPIHIRTHKHTYTFMYGIAATHIWIIWLNDEFRVLWVLFIVKGPGRTRSLEICVRGRTRVRGNWLQRKISPKLY